MRAGSNEAIGYIIGIVKVVNTRYSARPVTDELSDQSANISRPGVPAGKYDKVARWKLLRHRAAIRHVSIPSKTASLMRAADFTASTCPSDTF